MKSIRFSTYGDASVLELADTQLAELKAHEVLVQVKAAGINPMDWKLRNGMMAKFMPLELPAVLGMEPAGIVEKVGSAVTAFKPGDRIVAFMDVPNIGAFSEYAIVNEASAVILPEEIDFKTGAAIPVTGITAWQALFDRLKVTAEQRVLIQGGAGALATFAIQFAKNAGAIVYAAASPNHNAFLKDLGVTEVFDYHDPKAYEGIEKFDAVLDTIGGINYQNSFSLVKPGGAIVTTNGAPGNFEDEEAKKLGIHALSLRAEVKPEDLAKIVELIRQGKVKVEVADVYDFDLESVKAALELSESGHVAGKLVVKIAD